MLKSESEWVIVSGAKGSIGSGLADRFLARGLTVLALDRMGESTGGSNDSTRLVYRALDLASESEVKAVLDETVPRGDRIGLLVNAVGLIWNEPVVALRGAALQPHRLKSWSRVIEANLTAPFVIASHVATRMARQGGGAIINFSSISGRGTVGQAAYSAAKAGVEGLTRAMAGELGQVGIRVNAVAPGFIDVPSTRAALTEEQLQATAERTPVGRLGQLNEVMDAIDFLAENPFVNGVVLDINGGLRL